MPATDWCEGGGHGEGETVSLSEVAFPARATSKSLSNLGGSRESPNKLDCGEWEVYTGIL